jgi:uncharacterized membrane protein YheB (UPF0754 family)
LKFKVNIMVFHRKMFFKDLFTANFLISVGDIYLDYQNPVYFCGMYLFFFPFAAAFLGWFFHRLFTNYLFRKIIPAKVPQLATGAGEYVSDKLLNINMISAKITDPQNLEPLRPYIEQHIDVFLKEKLKEKMPAIAMFVGEKTIEMLKKGLMEEIDSLLPALLDKYAGNLAQQLDIAELVRRKIAELPLASLLEKGARKEIALFHGFGALTGFVIGWVLVLLVVIAG